MSEESRDGPGFFFITGEKSTFLMLLGGKNIDH